MGRGTDYGLMYTENSNVRNTLLERARRQTAERAGELVFNVLWSYVKDVVKLCISIVDQYENGAVKRLSQVVHALISIMQLDLPNQLQRATAPRIRATESIH